MRKLEKEGEVTDQLRADLAASTQEAIVDVLGYKAIQAMKQTGLKRLVVAGGVGANRHLREFLEEQMERLRGKVYFPPMVLCTDNGAMIAHAASERVKAGLVDLSERNYSHRIRTRWDLADI